CARGSRSARRCSRAAASVGGGSRQLRSSSTRSGNDGRRDRPPVRGRRTRPRLMTNPNDERTTLRPSVSLIVALAVGLLLRLAYAHHVRHQPLFGDGVLFEFFARGLLDGRYPEETLNFRSMLAPGYPA